MCLWCFVFSSRRRHTRCYRDWSSDVCSSDLVQWASTRPVVDAHWASHEQLIGQTGRSIKPELLITCGTSGAVQYTAAIRGTGTVVAVNHDPHAPIFRMADLGVVTDTQSF